jgi:hypothetical protein
MPDLVRPPTDARHTSFLRAGSSAESALNSCPREPESLPPGNRGHVFVTGRLGFALGLTVPAGWYTHSAVLLGAALPFAAARHFKTSPVGIAVTPAATALTSFGRHPGSMAVSP